jgi:2'-5' RNA ligase
MEKGSLKRHFFVAVNLPNWAKNLIEDEIKSEQTVEGRDDWKWKDKAEYHISLAFPGALDEEQLQRLRAALSTLDHDAFDLNLEGTQFFLRHDDPKRKGAASHVLWVGLSDKAESELRVLHYKIVDILRRNGFHYGRNDITPHVSIVKVPSTELSAVKDFAHAHGDIESNSWPCTKIGLYETLTPDQEAYAERIEKSGSPYIEIEHYPLNQNNRDLHP